MLRKIALVVVVVIAAVLGLALTQPDSFSVQRSATIGAPPDQVFALVNDLKAFNRWSPWVRREPTVKLRYSGPESGAGAGYTWQGEQTGAGGMTITESTPPSKVALKLDFTQPFESHNRVEFGFVPEGGGTRVTWAMSGPMPFISKLMSVFADMDKMIGPDFEQGLANLKAEAEKR